MDNYLWGTCAKSGACKTLAERKIGAGNISVDQKSDPFKNAQRAALP
jgi:hypothetical protein